MLPFGTTRRALWSPSSYKIGGNASFYSNLTLDSLPAWMTATGATNGWTTNSSGTYISSSAPRFDHNYLGVSYGLLQEVASNNYGTNEELTSGYSVNNGSVSAATNALYGSRSLITLTQTSSNAISSAKLSQTVGINQSYSVTGSVALLAGTNSTCYFGLIGSGTTYGQGANSLSVGYSISGPATLTQITGSLFRVDNLSTTIPSIIAINRNKLANNSNENVGPIIYLQYQAGGSANDTVKFGLVNLDAPFDVGITTTMIVTTTSVVSRSADTIGLTGSGATAASQGYTIVKYKDRLTGIITYTSYAPGTISFANTGSRWLQEIGIYPSSVGLAQINAMIAAQNLT